MDIIKLKSGKEVYANGLILGIGPGLTISEGYDGMLYPASDDYLRKEDLDALSVNDLNELADIAIDRWNRFKAMVNA